MQHGEPIKAISMNDYGLDVQSYTSSRCKTFFLTTPTQGTGPTPVGTEDSFPPVNWLKCEKTAHLHKSSYTSILPQPPKPIRN
jgi:hypothetical protein